MNRAFMAFRKFSFILFFLPVSIARVLIFFSIDEFLALDKRNIDRLDKKNIESVDEINIEFIVIEVFKLCFLYIGI